MIKKLCCLLIMGMFTVTGLTESLAGGIGPVDDLLIMTENYPPYNYMEQGRLKGIAVDLMALMLEKLGADQSRDDIKLYPWARGYSLVLNQKNTCLFSMTRTRHREELFKWVGPIAPTTISLIAKKNRNIKISAVNDLKQYKTGVIIDDIGEQLLLLAGTNKKYLDRIGGINVIEQSINKLDKGRIDLWAYEEQSAYWVIKNRGFDLAAFETVFILEQSHLYYAFHRQTPAPILSDLQNALDGIKQNGDYQKILDRYLGFKADTFPEFY